MATKIISKRCTKCKQIKPFSKFYKDKRATDNHCSSCKDCGKTYQREYKQTKKYKQSQKRYRQTENYKNSIKKYKQSDKGKKTIKRFNQTEKAKIAMRRGGLRYRRLHPERGKAKDAVNHAIAAGKLERIYRQRCIICRFRRATHYHHPDYNKPLYVFPVCRKCHRIIHNC